MTVKAPQKKTGQTAGPAKKQSIPAAKGPRPTGEENKAAARRNAAAALCAELKKLRAELKETVKQVSLRIDSRIADTLRILEKKQAPGEPGNLPGAKTTTQMAKKLRALKIKPGKGKLKDIAHIERMVEKIAEKTAPKP